MRKVEIIHAIDRAVFKRRGKIATWRIGLTDDPDRTRSSFRSKGMDLSRWQEWEADSGLDAVAIGELFETLGMQSAGASDVPEESPATVYVF